jgi:hypothetical protein
MKPFQRDISDVYLANIILALFIIDKILLLTED